MPGGRYGASPRRGTGSGLTIRDIAAHAGVSVGAVSSALNGRPGVSDRTRAHIRAVAEELGWVPDAAARRLAGARTEMVGLVLPVGTAAMLGVAPYFMEFIAGTYITLAERGYSLVLQAVADVAAEVALYRRWAGSRRVDGVIVVDVRVDDPRVALLAGLRLPAVVAGPPEAAGGLPSVWTDDGAAMRQAVRYLATLGHRRIAHIGGPPHLTHLRIRQEAFERTAAELGLSGTTWHSDFTTEAGTRATRDALISAPRPTALLYDGDMDAVAALGVTRELGIAVPGEVSILAWDDSTLCAIASPALSAMSHDVQAYGAQVARCLFGAIDGEPPAAHVAAIPVIRPRASTAPPPPAGAASPPPAGTAPPPRDG